MRLTPFLLLALGVAACGSDDDPVDPPQTVTWFQDIAPLMSKRCMSCHQAGAIAPFVLTDYDSAVDHANQAMVEVDKNRMPPFDAREEADCAPTRGWVDDQRLTADEKEKLRAWIAGGFERGTEAAIPPPPNTDLTGVNKTVGPKVGWATSGQRDQFVCYVLDPQLTDPVTWVTGLQVRPGIVEVVHHVVIAQLAADDTTYADKEVGVPFECGADMPTDFVVNIWTPGNQPMQTDADLAIPIFGGAKFIVQLHYHPAGRAYPPDLTTYEFRTSPKWPKRMYLVTAFGNEDAAPALQPGDGDAGAPRFFIPKNAADHPEHMRITAPDLGGLEDVRVHSVNPHMHLVGTHISARIERPAARGGEPQSECLANGAWNFDWQRTYTYDVPTEQLPTLQAGDVVDVRCKWNNTLQNPFVLRMLAEAGLGAQSIDLKLGEETFDEMCLEIMGLSVKAPPEPASRTAPFPMPDLSALRKLSAVR